MFNILIFFAIFGPIQYLIDEDGRKAKRDAESHARHMNGEMGETW